MVDSDLVGLFIGRSCVSAGFALVQLASPALLLEINKGDYMATQRATTVIQTATTLSAFFVRPYVGAYIDSYGRRPAIIAGPLASMVARLIVLIRPNNYTNLLYRVTNMMAMMPLYYGIIAYLSDKFGGRASLKYAEVTRYMRVAESLTRIVFLQVGARIKDKKKCFLLASVMNFVAASVFTVSLKETLKAKDRQEFHPRKSSNPFHLLQYFTKTAQLKRLALLLLLTSIPLQNMIGELYRRQKYGWKVKETALLLQVGNICEVVSPLIALPIYRKLGAELTFACGQLTSSLACLNSAFTPNSKTLYLNPIVCSLFDQDAATNVLIDKASETSPVGEGRLSAAIMGLNFPLGLVFPTVFSELYVRSMGAPLNGNLPFLVCAALQFANAAFLIPSTFELIAPGDIRNAR